MRPERCFVHGSILSEIADIYSAPASYDAERAREALAKSNVMHYIASTQESLSIAAGREITFNRLRTGLLTGEIGKLIRPSLEEILDSARSIPIAPTFEEEPRRNTGLRHELLGQAIPLWLTSEHAQRLNGQYLIGWPSYVRQDRVPGARVDARSRRPIARNPSFDMRLSTYSTTWVEAVTERRKIQLKSASDPRTEYAPDIAVVPIQIVGGMLKPRDGRAFAGDMKIPYDQLSDMRRTTLNRFIRFVMERMGLSYKI